MRLTQFLFIGVSLVAVSVQAAGGSWAKYGQTNGPCQFKASFHKLKSYPFARLDVEADADADIKAETVPLALNEEVLCKKQVYVTAYPRNEKLPTYVVEMTNLCQGRQADMKVTLFRSGVSIECPML
jgi:hypothetical protein